MQIVVYANCCLMCLLVKQIIIAKFSANMEGAIVRLLGVERGNATTLSEPTDGALHDGNSV